jgi:nucleoside-diphosphate-sugar epimerase
MIWNGKRVLVTGGASFIGSHLVDVLLLKGANVTVADDFSSGRLENLEYSMREEGTGRWRSEGLEVCQGNLKETSFVKQMVAQKEAIFHLAAAHGGRGFIDTHPVQCCTNMILDQMLFEEAYEAGVERVCFASSACVYPAYLQEEAGSSYLLKEDDADPFVRDKALADLEYGWAKFMGEMALKAYHRQYGMKTSSVRIFTAYGPRENETHAIIALIAKALVGVDPYSIWGTGEQDRNFTYVTDIVDGMIRTAEEVTDGSALNVGRDDRITINETVEQIFSITGRRPKQLEYDLTKPQGVASRAADLTRSRDLLNWEPKISYQEGFKRTIDWYKSAKDLDWVEQNLTRLLMER